MARNTNNTIVQHSTRIDQAHDKISTLANTIESVKRSVDLLDHKVSRPNCSLALAEADIKELTAKVNRIASQMQQSMHAHGSKRSTRGKRGQENTEGALHFLPALEYASGSHREVGSSDRIFWVGISFGPCRFWMPHLGAELGLNLQ